MCFVLLKGSHRKLAMNWIICPTVILETNLEIKMINETSLDHLYYVPDNHPHLMEVYRNCTVTGHNSSYFHENDCGTYMFPGPSPSQPWWIQLIVQILYGIVCCVGLCGNTLVIYVVVRFSKMQTVGRKEFEVFGATLIIAIIFLGDESLSRQFSDCGWGKVFWKGYLFK